MRILFDQGAPAPLRRHLHPHPVDTTAERGWSTISNGELLKCAEEEGYEVFITTDQNLRYQQNLTRRRLGIVVLMTLSWPRTQQRIPEILAPSIVRWAVAMRKWRCDVGSKAAAIKLRCCWVLSIHSWQRWLHHLPSPP
jgi:hypothetical protein